MKNIYIQQNGQNLGPYTISEVNEFIANGSVFHSDLAYHDGLANWIPLCEIEGTLFPPGRQLALPPSPQLPASPSVPMALPGPVPTQPFPQPVVIVAPSGNSTGNDEGSMQKGFGSMFGGCMGIAIALVVLSIVALVGCFACSAVVSEAADEEMERIEAEEPEF